MLRLHLRELLLALSVALSAPIGLALADVQAGAPEIGQPWGRATPNSAQVHAVTIENGVMRMHPVEGGLEIKPGSITSMSVDLATALREGEPVAGTPVFESTGMVRMPVPSRVRSRSLS
jgi:periplasmic copper chaperone A